MPVRDPACLADKLAGKLAYKRGLVRHRRNKILFYRVVHALAECVVIYSWAASFTTLSFDRSCEWSWLQAESFTMTRSLAVMGFVLLRFNRFSSCPIRASRPAT